MGKCAATANNENVCVQVEKGADTDGKPFGRQLTKTGRKDLDRIACQMRAPVAAHVEE